MLIRFVFIYLSMFAENSCAQTEYKQKQIKMLKKGDKAPAINSIDQNGEQISLEQFKGKKIVLYFYPKDMTPGCMRVCVFLLLGGYSGATSSCHFVARLFLSGFIEDVFANAPPKH